MVLNPLKQFLTLFSAFPQMVTCLNRNDKLLPSHLYHVPCFGWAVGGSWQLAQRCPEIGRDAWATCPFEVCNYLKNLKNRTDRILQNHTYNQLCPLFCIVLILLYPFVTAVTPWLCCMWLHVGKNVNWMKRRGRRLKKKPRKSRTHPKQSAQPENWT